MAKLLARTVGYEDHIFDLVVKSLARDSTSWATTVPRHSFNGLSGPGRSVENCESWKFPVVEPHYAAELPVEERLRWNQVTFVFRADNDGAPPAKVEVVGLPEIELRAVPLEPVGDSIYFAATVLLPAGRVYRYAFRVDGVVQPDPINPQRVQLANGEVASQFFTDYCYEPVTFERWELALLRRVTNHILPFNSREAELFQLNPGGGGFAALSPQLYCLDHGVGAANYIDKLLAREERHHQDAYRRCLKQIDRILRQRQPYLEPRDITEDEFIKLYDEMGSGSVAGWDYNDYASPQYFLFLLRRHTWTGAFCHPKYGGNGNSAGWLWLAGKLPPFNFGGGLEAPWGDNGEYRG
ncbi:MAG: hypothetical protein RLZZ399_2502 [Verrucomicrobiota bacterium]|jgi:hypothetical protein